jgi:lysophospholipase L1-like esterase
VLRHVADAHCAYDRSIAAQYDRTADVVLRGYSGYNSVCLLAALPTVMRPADAPALIIVQVGTNDSVRPAPLRGHPAEASRQHVPVAKYKENVKEIVKELRASSDGKACIIIMTPTPIDDEKRAGFERDQHLRSVLWTDKHTQPYVSACVAAAKESKVPVINLYDTFKQVSQLHTTWPAGQQCESCGAAVATRATSSGSAGGCVPALTCTVKFTGLTQTLGQL